MSILSRSLVAAAIILTAAVGSVHAAETITVEAHVSHGARMLATPRVVVESGKTATIRTGSVELTVAPTAFPDGTITVATTLFTGADTATPVKVAEPKITVASGKSAKIEVGEWSISLTPTVVK